MTQLKGNSLGAVLALSLVTAMALPSAVAADEIQLTGRDGTLNMTGTFLGFEDNAYIIDTTLGPLRILASQVSCVGAACPSLTSTDVDLRIAGSETIGLGLMSLLIEGYSDTVGAAVELSSTNDTGGAVGSLISNLGYGDEMGQFQIAPTTSADAFAALLENEAQIGMSARRIAPSEARALSADGAGNMIDPQQEHIIAVDGLIVIVHPDNPVSEISVDNLQDIYTGNITNWAELGGPDAAINVVARQPESATRTLFEERIFGDVAPAAGANTTVAVNNSVSSQLVNEDPFAIGYVGFPFQRGAKPLTLINECGIRMVPDAFSARTEEYALQRRLYLYTREDDRSDIVDGIIDFAVSPSADQLIGKAGFIGFGVDRRSQSSADERGLVSLAAQSAPYEAGLMQDMVAKMADYDRLSTTFRFNTGSARLDERGQVDLKRLVDFLAASDQALEVLVVGFTDSVGQFDGNLQLSKARAEQIVAEIQAAGADRLGNTSISSIGYGEIAPSGCNADNEGRRINRRVEVWVRQST